MKAEKKLYEITMSGKNGDYIYVYISRKEVLFLHKLKKIFDWGCIPGFEFKKVTINNNDFVRRK